MSTNYLVNKELVRKRFAKSLNTYESQADVQLNIARKLAKSAVSIFPNGCKSLFEIGCGTGFLTREILSKITVDKLFLNDLVDVTDRKDILLGEHGSETNIEIKSGDAETIDFPTKLNAVISSSTLQWFNNLPAFFGKVHNSLQHDGVLMFNTFGPNNLLEIKKLTDTGLNYPHKTSLQKMLSNSFEILEMWEETQICYFDSPRHVLRHLKETGVTATESNFKWTKTNLQEFEMNYKLRFEKDGQISLSWHVYYFVCKKK